MDWRSLLYFMVCAGVCAAQALPAADQAILERLDRLEKQNAELLEQIKGLRELVAGSRPQNQQVSDRQQVSEHRIEEQAQTKVEASQRFPIQLTGMALFNAFKNGAYGGTAQNPVTAALTPSPSVSGGSLRQSILGLTYQGPKTLWGGKVSGSLFMDFFGGDSRSLNHLLRLRLADVQIEWPHTTFMLGQDKPLVSWREPNSLAQVGVSPLTGAGNPWLWQPQARVEQRFTVSSRTAIKADLGLFQTSEQSGQVAQIASVIEGARPAIESRVALQQRFSDERVMEIAGVFHENTSHLGGYSIPSRLFGLDWFIKPSSKLEISGLLFSGKNFANLGALGGITFPSANLPVAIHGSGGWAQVRFMPTQKLSFDIYGGQQYNRRSDLNAGAIGRNQFYAANAMYYLGQNLLTSFEVSRVITTYPGTGNRAANHYDLAIAYLF